jgi:hypothetical protein
MKKIDKLAELIVDAKVFTSRHLFAVLNENTDKFNDVVSDVFRCKQLSNTTIDEIENKIIPDNNCEVIFYGHLDESLVKCSMHSICEDHLPIFDKVYIVYGDDIDRLEKAIVKQFRENKMH